MKRVYRYSLGGVGHGELWNVSYEGRNFKGMAR
jgi:hypothetical protein